ncbi:MAG: hypothetical protein V3T17_05055 [Pseudomonadales bacterium]
MHITRYITSLLLIALMLNANAADDLLLEDDYTVEQEVFFQQGKQQHQQQQKNNWRDGFKYTLEYSHTVTDEGTLLQRSMARLEYEYAVAEGWYTHLDGKLSRFWSNDRQAQQRDQAYSDFKEQQAWVQYSQGACAHKLGKQQLIWGEVEGTFAVDIVTPFDYTEQLLTDFNNIRLSQTMLQSECYFKRIQTQLFYLPKARTDRFSHEPGDIAWSTGSEWGGRIKYNWPGADVSLMYARLYNNTPVPTLQNTILQLAVENFDFLGLSSSIARGRLLMKFDLAYKQKQLVALSNNTTDRLDFAAGLEYVTSNNHNINAGVWLIRELDNTEFNESITLTMGWRKTYWNDNLSMSLLAYVVDEPELASLTIQAQYKWNDYWTISSAIGIADISDEVANSPLAQPEQSLTLSIKYAF